MAGREDKGGVIRRGVQGALKMDDNRYLLCTTFIKYFITEMIGTGVLVFLGCLGVRTQNNHMGIALFFGLAAFVAIQVTCHNSGGHINPAITVCSLFLSKLTIPMAINFIVAQVVGSTLGYGILQGLTHNISTGHDCSTTLSNRITVGEGFLYEFIMTAILSLVVCSIWDPRNGQLIDSVTLKFGLAISTLAYVGGSEFTGCSMNPARSFGPAVWTGQWANHWVYWIGPIFGGIFAGITYRLFFCAPLNPCPKISDKIELQTVS